ncbi:Zinc knuckle CX2CX4HX4C [Sesbania bispinosa]|nr:Zinc knuckle CX2CX4HX4C [Sesbania bispinosa]
MGYKIGACMRNVQEVEIYEEKAKGIYLCSLVNIDVAKPLLGGISVGNIADGVNRVGFQYERMPEFSYSCGLVDHEEESCKQRGIGGLVVECFEEKDWGPWMRSESLTLSTQSNKKDTKLKKDVVMLDVETENVVPLKKTQTS